MTNDTKKWYHLSFPSKLYSQAELYTITEKPSENWSGKKELQINCSVFRNLVGRQYISFYNTKYSEVNQDEWIETEQKTIA